MIERKKKNVLVPLILLCLCLLLPAMLHLANGTDLLGPTYYNTYTRQAMAWREGLLHLPVAGNNSSSCHFIISLIKMFFHLYF